MSVVIGTLTHLEVCNELLILWVFFKVLLVVLYQFRYVLHQLLLSQLLLLVVLRTWLPISSLSGLVLGCIAAAV